MPVWLQRSGSEARLGNENVKASTNSAVLKVLVGGKQGAQQTHVRRRKLKEESGTKQAVIPLMDEPAVQPTRDDPKRTLFLADLGSKVSMLLSFLVSCAISVAVCVVV